MGLKKCIFNLIILLTDASGSQMITDNNWPRPQPRWLMILEIWGKFSSAISAHSSEVKNSNLTLVILKLHVDIRATGTTEPV